MNGNVKKGKKLFLIWIMALTLTISGGAVGPFAAVPVQAANKMAVTSLTIECGAAKTLKVKGASDNKISVKVKNKKTTVTIKWKSTKKSVATVSAKGRVKAVAAGSATIRAYYTYQGKTTVLGTCKVKVQDPLTEEQVYQSMIALQEKYPEGTSWTNDNYYEWKGGIYSGGYGCAAFAMRLSDEAFGSRPARKYTSKAKVRVGDILRINNDTHSVIVLAVNEDGTVTIAEGNYNASVHWGRKIDLSSSGLVYGLTRYPK